MNTDNIRYTGGVPTLGNNKTELLFDEALNLPTEKKSNWKRNIFLFFTILAIVIVGYIALTSSPDTTPPIEKRFVYSTLDLSLKNLRPLDKGYYEAWLVDSEDYISVGKFSINNKGEIYGLDGNKLERFDIYKPTAIPDSLIISIEANVGTNIKPSSTIVMKGNFDEKGKLKLSFKALNTKKIKGKFTLATETVTEIKTKPQGIWFYKNADSTIDSSLELPDAPEGWIYESWLVYEGHRQLSLGKFRKIESSDTSSKYSGPERAPNFPGEDFINTESDDYPEGINIFDGTSFVMITLEPYIEEFDPTGDASSQFRLLAGNIPSKIKANTLYPMKFNTNVLPRGSAEFTVIKEQDIEFNSLLFKEINLPTLTGGHYEAWLKFEENEMSIGKFNVLDGKVVGLDKTSLDLIAFEEIQVNPTSFFITIESEGDMDIEASNITVLEADVDSEIIEMNFQEIELDKIAGQYILGTPTDRQNNNETSGIWFIDNSTLQLTSSLKLPKLKTGWVYEAWILYKGELALTSGRFSKANAKDKFSGFSGKIEGPNFPGEDYLNNLPNELEAPLSLTDGSTMVVVSIESEINDSTDIKKTNPYITILNGTIITDATDHKLYKLRKVKNDLPYALIELSIASF